MHPSTCKETISRYPSEASSVLHIGVESSDFSREVWEMEDMKDRMGVNVVDCRVHLTQKGQLILSCSSLHGSASRPSSFTRAASIQMVRVASQLKYIKTLG